MNQFYTPILKNRPVEMKSLKNLYEYTINKKIIPLIEIVQEKSSSKSNRSLCEKLKNTSSINTPFMTDIIKLSKHKKTKSAINTFLNKLNNNPLYEIDLFHSLSSFKNLIPIISYDESNYNFNQQLIVSNSKKLRNFFNLIGYKLKINYFYEALNEIISVITQNDIIIFDIEHTKYNLRNLLSYYIKLREVKFKYNINAFIINSVILDNLTNKSLKNNVPIYSIDNRLRDNYISLGFDGFGDYATIKSCLPDNGSTIIPGFIYYSFKNNSYIGFRYNINEFRATIAPSVVNPNYWKDYSDNYHNKCPCCKSIVKILNEDEKYKIAISLSLKLHLLFIVTIATINFNFISSLTIIFLTLL
ncbi:hypothetical protein CLTEP_17640 [Clostridium tepidiprofundi DSM 19306]|uniref:Uncharacterized protein n=1 Tax=Clostridium tepidiprofundi DSM 19306 TaxID=1121338 RepID=A0A151B324_9CLOT|nr:hypothetical protein [Clostridium tepidiprofundi]KYH34339.1 hypothetical protein CLTEP_17640 [Clostridium tepidiprofundi DSM 19306]